MNTNELVAAMFILANNEAIRKAVEENLRKICGEDYDLEMVTKDGEHGEKTLWFRHKSGFLMEPCEALGRGLTDVLIYVVSLVAPRLLKELETLLNNRE